MINVLPDTLDREIEFDHVFSLTPNPLTTNVAVMRDATDYPAGHDMGYPPSVYIDGEVDAYGDAHVTGDAYMDGDGWDFYSVGYTGQFGVKKSNPVMHASEYVGGRLAQDMINDGGTFVVTSVDMLSDDEYDGDPIVGWVVLRKSED